ncbi:MAG TPA: hypothetical protein VGQ83_12830, partial [Polyangia bacterium]
GLDLALAGLTTELRPLIAHLRALAREVTHALAARLDAELAAVEDAVGRLELPRGRKRRRAVVEALRGALAEARRLQVEVAPARGRRRDLRRIAAVGRRVAAAVRASRTRRA